MKYVLTALMLMFSCAAAAQQGAPVSSAAPVFDIHVHLHDGDESLSAYRADAEAAGLQATGIGAMWFGGPNQAPAGDPDDIRARNDALIGMAASDPAVMPIATVHPYDGQAALDELERIAARGVKVIKLHAHTQRFDVKDPRLLALVRKAGELDIAVLMDNANIVAGDSENLFNLAIQAQGTKFVFAHIGGLNFRFWNILPLARTADGLALENVYFDISATVLLAADSPIEEEFVWTLRNVGIDSLILGSDYPQLSLADTLEALEKLDLSDEEKAKIRGGNARRLFGL